MAGCCSAIIYPPSLIRRLGRREPSPSRLDNNQRHSPIHILNDDVLLNIFHLYHLANPDEFVNVAGTSVAWHRQRWWYKLVHVSRQWRNVILESPSRLDLHLFCTNGVPVADMLAHSPPLPLTICYRTSDQQEMGAEDESSILLALSHRDRVRRIYFWERRNLGKFVAAMDGQFPILEHMHIYSWTDVVLPVTFQAPNLRHLKLWATSIPIGSPLLHTTASLVTLSLFDTPYFPPSYLLTWLSLMAQLQRVSIRFHYPLQNPDVGGQSHQPETPDMITLANLQRFEFQGVSAYLESLVARISAPSLDTFHVYLLYQPTFIVPRLLQFMQTPKSLTFSAVQVTFCPGSVSLHAVPCKWNTPLLLKIFYSHRDWQVASAAQLFGSLSPIFSVVEQVTFSHKDYKYSSDWYNNSDRVQWRELLRPFINAKVIHGQDHLVAKIFRSLPSDEGEPPLGLLPNLEEVGYSGGSDVRVRDAFTTFLNERREAGHPVSLWLLNPSIFDEYPAVPVPDSMLE